MGNLFTNEHRIRENAIKASCVELLKRILILHETPSTENKEHFLSQISQVRIEIDANFIVIFLDGKIYSKQL